MNAPLFAITKYGYTIVLVALLIGGAIITTTIVFVEITPVRYAVISFVAIILALIVNFFRDPERSVPSTDDAVVSPADGRIVVIKEVLEPEFLKSEAVQVSIFMSPLDVHVNRFPISGVVQYFRHVAGEFMVAWDEKSSERNERTLIGIERNGIKILFKQIAGTVARRIIADVHVGSKAIQGSRFGMIRFGSRVDVLMPKGTQIQVQLQERVVAGETVLALCKGLKE